ncbi:hypothetical protein Dimus_039688 [Dionaea muscipula]
MAPIKPGIQLHLPKHPADHLNRERTAEKRWTLVSICSWHNTQLLSTIIPKSIFPHKNFHQASFPLRALYADATVNSPCAEGTQATCPFLCSMHLRRRSLAFIKDSQTQDCPLTSTVQISFSFKYTELTLLIHNPSFFFSIAHNNLKIRSSHIPFLKSSLVLFIATPDHRNTLQSASMFFKNRFGKQKNLSPVNIKLNPPCKGKKPGSLNRDSASYLLNKGGIMSNTKLFGCKGNTQIFNRPLPNLHT